MASSLQQSMSELSLSEMGQKGGILITDTTAITGVFRKMVVLADATFTTLTTEYTKNDDSTLAVGADWGTLYGGTILDGKFTAVTLATGTVLMIV